MADLIDPRGFQLQPDILGAQQAGLQLQQSRLGLQQKEQAQVSEQTQATLNALVSGATQLKTITESFNKSNYVKKLYSGNLPRIH